MAKLTTPLTTFLGIEKPILLAGMNVAAGPELAAAVTNHGGLGVIGGVGYSEKMLRSAIAELKSGLNDKNAPFGVDLLLPQVGGNARKTNKDYTGGTLPALIDIIIESKAKLFVSAVGVPPKWAVDKLHAAGILYANIIGAPKHATKALDIGADLIIAQGGEGGGHTGSIPTSVLIPQVVEVCKGRISKFTGQPISVVAAGGIYDGCGLAMALSLGAQGVWVGTRFVCAKEAGAPPRHQQAVINAGFDSTIRSEIYTGRPMSILKTPYVMDWEENRLKEKKALLAKGVLPVYDDIEKKKKAGEEISFKDTLNMTPLLMGKCAGAIHDILPAKVIMDDMVSQAVSIIQKNQQYIAKL